MDTQNCEAVAAIRLGRVPDKGFHRGTKRQKARYPYAVKNVTVGLTLTNLSY